MELGPDMVVSYAWQMGPHLWMVCSACNYNTHRCFFCGDDLTHAEAVNGTHPCYQED